MRLIEACCNIPQPHQASIKFKVEEPAMLKQSKTTTPVLIEDLGMIYPKETSKQKKRLGLYLCSCGNMFSASVSDVKSKNTKSCGCLKVTHNMTNHGMYQIWNNMVQRCNNRNVDSYEYYGGRGIKVCDRWLDINNFIDDMYPTYQKGLSIDRINADGNYEPSNCRWVTQEVQARNKRILQCNNTSGYKGVVRDSICNKWRSRIMVSKKMINLGRFNTALEAAIAYDEYVIKNGLEHSKNFYIVKGA